MPRTDTGTVNGIPLGHMPAPMFGATLANGDAINLGRGIDSPESMVTWFAEIASAGLGMHPEETAIESDGSHRYYNLASGMPYFTDSEALRFDLMMQACYDIWAGDPANGDMWEPCGVWIDVQSMCAPADSNPWDFDRTEINPRILATLATLGFPDPASF